MVEAFYDRDTSDDSKLSILSEYSVDYVIYGPAEKQVGEVELWRVPFLSRVYSTDSTSVFQVSLFVLGPDVQLKGQDTD